MTDRPYSPPPYTPLASPHADLAPRYDAVVIGSGYGGAVAACRLAQARKPDGSALSVCVLERGQEIAPGGYPTHALDFAQMAQTTTVAGVLGPRDGLFDFRTDGDLAVIQGCGLGGTSLINAGVAIEPEAWVFEDARWPEGLRRDLGRVHAGMARARTLLGLQPLPADRPVPKKLQALRDSGAALGAPVVTADVAVSFEAHTNAAGVDLHACTGCGDCVMGCNRGAKNTTLYNYLPLARRHGAAIFTQVEVRHLERRNVAPPGAQPDPVWLVHFRRLGVDVEDFTDDLGFVAADLVVLGAGTLGTNEILLRSRAQGLPLSARLGERFSGNGDVLAFGYNTDRPIDAVGTGDRDPAPEAAPGPCISGILDLRGREAEPELGMVIMEGVIPASFAPAMPLLLETAATALGTDTDDGVLDGLRELGREALSLVGGARHGAVANTQTYLVMCHDEAAGRLTLPDGDRARVSWPGAGTADYLQLVDARLQQATAALGGTHVPDPVWSKALGHRLVTCHPLGGVAMAETAADGASDHRGRVFAGDQGTAVHPGLYVSDAAVIPRSLGCNPLLTITALAERTLELLLAEHGWTLDTRPPPPLPVARRRLGLRFTERMAGRIGLGDDAAFAPAQMPDDVLVYDASFVVTAESEDLDATLGQPGHEAPLSGTFRCAGLDPEPLQIDDGRIALFVPSPDAPDARLMRYRFTAVAEDGRAFFVAGEKILGDDSGLDAWRDTTTLFTTIHAGRDDSGPVLGRGTLYVHLGDLLESLGTIEVLRARSTAEELDALRRTAGFFFGALAGVYLDAVAT